MHQFLRVSILLWALSVIVVVFGARSQNLNFKLSPKITSARQKMLGDLVMSPSENSEEVVRKECLGIGMKCTTAEDCCTNLCLRRYNECVF